MTIQVNPEAEQAIGQAIQAGLIGDADDVLAIGVEAIPQRLQSRAAAGPELPTEQWPREFTAWVHGHSTTTPLLSGEAISRDLIYGTRGL